MIKKTAILILPAILIIDACGMVNVTGQKTFGHERGNIPLFSLGIMHKCPLKRQYFETGAMVQPAKKMARIGTYGGYYYAIWPIFRPGILAGVAFEKQSSWKAELYYGMCIQAGIFTIKVTGIGIGGGLNIPLKNNFL